MAAVRILRERGQTRGEEIANSVSHGIALLATLGATPILVMDAAQRGTAANVVGSIVFAISMVLVYLTSTILHMLPHGPAKKIFRVLDHCAIFLLIAGTYTPFTLGVLSGPWGWTLFGLEWGMAAIGISLKVYGGIRYTGLSTLIYIAMGWMILIAAKPVWALVPHWGIFWLVAGGLAYTVGTIFFMVDRKRYYHLLWHLFVIAGTVCHFVAVLRYSY